MNEALESVRNSFESCYLKKSNHLIATTAIRGPERRPDFILLNGPRGAIWIVEIKRVDYHLTDDEFTRAVDYLESLEVFLDDTPEFGTHFPIRRLTFIVNHIDRLSRTNRRLLKESANVERRSWYNLLEQNDQAHQDFLRRSRNCGAPREGSTPRRSPQVAWWSAHRGVDYVWTSIVQRRRYSPVACAHA